MSRTITAALLAVTALSVFSLASGASFLEAPLPGGLPVGNALTALGLCAAAGAAVAISGRGTVARILAAVALVAAVAWLPVSIALAGNLTLDFRGGRGDAWIALSGATVALVVLVLVWTLIAAGFRAMKKGKQVSLPAE